MDPWLDKECLIPGQNWKISIKNAIKNSRYFIPLFSSISVAKRGYVHKEFKYALDVFDEFPESEIFVIPARLDNCEIPYDKLKDIEYVDLFPRWEDGIRRIIQATSFASVHDRTYAQSLTDFSEALNNVLRDHKISQGQLQSINTSMSELAKEVEDLKPGDEQEIDYVKQISIESKTTNIVQKVLNVLPQAAEKTATFTPLAPFGKLIGKGFQQIIDGIHRRKSTASS